MSQPKKKKMKQSARLRTLVASLMLIAPAVYAANNTEFSSRPLVGVSASFAPHIALALSVEFPTAGAAYPQHNILTVRGNNTSSPMTERYLGYFDNTKCYVYNHTGGYFEPKSKAKDEPRVLDGKNVHYYGLCNTGGDKEEFSGNMLNFMTMTAIDIFRSAMTGGNRAMGTGIAQSDYINADTPTTTFLRRANIKNDNNGIGNAMGTYRIRDRQLNALNAKNNGTLDDVKRLLPHYFVDVMMKDTIAGESTDVQYDQDGYTRDNSNGTFGKPRKLGFRAINGVGSNDAEYVLGSNAARQRKGEMAGINDKFSDTRLHFYNDGFTMRIARKVGTAISLNVNGQQLFRASPTSALNLAAASRDKFYEYYAVMDESSVEAKYRESARKWANPLNVVVKVCDASVGLEENCKAYGNNYKPEGLLQTYTKSSGMRFATFGYLNITGNGVDGGVLRSRMKTLIDDKKLEGESYNTVYGDEWNKNTGVFNVNPDTTDASRSGVTNSGTINYLNKFGDKSGYKGNDPAGELYETALTYLRGTNADINSNKAIYQTTLTDDAKDGFPVIYNWDDPYKRGIDPKAQHCHANSIIFIGDTNTHHDNRAGNYQTSPGKNELPKYLERLFGHEPTLRNGTLATHNFGSYVVGRKDSTGKITQTEDAESGNSPAYIAGLAYWARTNNIRDDITKNIKGAKPINSGNFMIDVVDSNDYKVKNRRLDNYNPAANTAYYMGNSYYLAAKYGGFTLREDSLSTDLNTQDYRNKPLPFSRSSWTDDEAGATSINQFIDGVPRNFALANNPTAMKAALDKAFAASAALNNPSQAATGLSTGLGDIVDVSETGEDYLLQSTYDYASLTGDVVILKPNFNAETKKIDLRPHKSIGDTLTKQFHGAGYASRKVFTVQGKNPTDFNGTVLSGIIQSTDMPKDVSYTDLANYILGDNSKENGALRKRKSLLGTVINSTATPILKAKNISGCGQFDNITMNRPIYYTAAANDGMLHIFAEDGTEKMAYMAGTALNKLDDFAKVGFQHQYLNDGTPVIQDVCLNNTPQTVLLGTTGRGGNAVYALNVTDLNDPTAAKNVMWEFTDADLGLTVSRPVITKGRDGNAYAIVSSGYHTDGSKPDNGYIFILDIATGNHWKVKLGTAGVGAPFVYDGDNDGIGDKIFVGDTDGKVWQLNSVNAGTSAPFAVAYSGNPLLTPNPGFARPITGAPYAEMVNGKLMVVVGTGRYFSEKDLDTRQQNYVYGLIADDQNAIIDDGGRNILLPQEITTNITSTTQLDPSKVAVYSVSSEKMESSHRGWRLKLIEGANISADALIRQRQVATLVFSRSTGDISASCVRGANSGLIQVDVKNGGRFPKSLVDTNGDRKFDENDSNEVGMLENLGINTPAASFFTYRDESGKIRSISLAKSGLGENEEAQTDLRDLETEAGVRRISWREIF